MINTLPPSLNSQAQAVFVAKCSPSATPKGPSENSKALHATVVSLLGQFGVLTWNAECRKLRRSGMLDGLVDLGPVVVQYICSLWVNHCEPSYFANLNS